MGGGGRKEGGGGGGGGGGVRIACLRVIKGFNYSKTTTYNCIFFLS